MISRRSVPLVIVAAVVWFGSQSLRGQDGTANGSSAVRAEDHPASRKLLASLYGGLIATQALDVHSTLTALAAGGREMNPMVRWAASNRTAFIGYKTAMTAGTTLLVEGLRRKHPKGSLVLLAAIDTAYTAVVARNYTNAGRMR